MHCFHETDSAENHSNSLVHHLCLMPTPH